MKARPPNILRSLTPATYRRQARTRSASSSSNAMPWIVGPGNETGARGRRAERGPADRCGAVITARGSRDEVTDRCPHGIQRAHLSPNVVTYRAENARRAAVRYAADDECLAGCGHPEPDDMNAAITVGRPS